MANYAIGDIQGCFDHLQALLNNSPFDPHTDTLWVAGDLINRGPKSLETLRFIKSLGDRAKVVLGNHDLHCLAIFHSEAQAKNKDTLDALFDANDCHELLDWLIQQKLCISDDQLGFVMSHAGIPAMWSTAQALELAGEVEAVLTDPTQRLEYFKHMYGNEPALWHDNLQGSDRWRTITNYLTRMRFVSSDGALDLSCKLPPEQAPENLVPWFSQPSKNPRQHKILFGHWAALQGVSNSNKIFALDTGCVWGGKLSMLRLEDETLYHCDCSN